MNKHELWQSQMIYQHRQLPQNQSGKISFNSGRFKELASLTIHMRLPSFSWRLGQTSDDVIQINCEFLTRFRPHAGIEHFFHRI